MAGNGNLHDSAKNKQDEFYTRLQLIEDELKHYRDHFKGKRVLCNCDDPYESNFFKFFAMNFNALGLKSLTAHLHPPTAGGCEMSGAVAPNRAFWDNVNCQRHKAAHIHAWYADHAASFDARTGRMLAKGRNGLVLSQSWG